MCKFVQTFCERRCTIRNVKTWQISASFRFLSARFLATSGKSTVPCHCDYRPSFANASRWWLVSSTMRCWKTGLPWYLMTPAWSMSCTGIESQFHGSSDGGRVEVCARNHSCTAAESDAEKLHFEPQVWCCAGERCQHARKLAEPLDG